MIHYRAETAIHIDTSALDCIQANLAAVGNAVHGVRLERELGAFVAFRPRPPEPEEAPEPTLPTIEPTLADRVAVAERVLGLENAPAVRHTGAHDLLRTLSPDWLLVVADAFDLPWVPYHRNTHTSHSFALRLTDHGVELLDAYTNDTPWGPARPRSWVLTPRETEELLPDGPMTAIRLRPAAGGPRPATHDAFTAAVEDLTTAARDGRVDGYLDAYARHRDQRAALSRLTVETWLLARQRTALARWLSSTRGTTTPPPDDRPAHEQARRWAEASEATYVAMRRSLRGRAVPGGVLDRVGRLLQEDGPALRSCLAGAQEVVR